MGKTPLLAWTSDEMSVVCGSVAVAAETLRCRQAGRLSVSAA
jgi:uncharacterized protein YunC (DUF1805 family)